LLVLVIAQAFNTVAYKILLTAFVVIVTPLVLKAIATSVLSAPLIIKVIATRVLLTPLLVKVRPRAILWANFLFGTITLWAKVFPKRTRVTPEMVLGGPILNNKTNKIISAIKSLSLISTNPDRVMFNKSSTITNFLTICFVKNPVRLTCLIFSTLRTNSI
jgi:hypothetical protein